MKQKPTKIRLDGIELDTSIQCRATIDTALVNEYAEQMVEGDEFPAVDLFGDTTRCWIGDGWHRILAAKQIGADYILAELHSGGRADALKHALGANALHGHRRSNADKRRCVEISLKEWPDESSRKIAERCGLSHTFVDSLRPQSATDANSKRICQDGRKYPARRLPDSLTAEEARQLEQAAEREGRDGGMTEGGPPREERRVLGPPCEGMQYARLAIMQLERIRNDDTERMEALAFVRGWIDEQEK